MKERADRDWLVSGRVYAKPRLRMLAGLWKVDRTIIDSPAFAGRNDAAEKWADRRNYFIGIRAGIALGRALDCTARGCPVPYNPEGWQQPTGEELGYGPYN